MGGAYLRGLAPLGLLLVGALAVMPAPRRALAPRSGADVYRRTLSATAWVRSTDKGQGSGWVVDRARRWLVTCYHVVGENDTVEVIFPVRRGDGVIAARQHYITHLPELRTAGLAVQGKVLRRNRDTDLALVELASVPAGVRELRLATRGAEPGDGAHVVGNRYDLGVLWVYGRGSVRQVRVLRDGYFNGGRQLAKGAPVVVASVPINEGDSGGPLVNDDGEVIGVSAAVAWEAQGAGLFIDVRAVRDLLGLARPARTEPPAAGPLTAREVYRRGARSVAVVQYTGGPRASGVLLDRARRLLLTTADAVGQEKTVDVTFPVYQPGGAVGEVGFYLSQRELLRKKEVLVSGVVVRTDGRRNLALVELTSVPPSATEVVFAVGKPGPGDRLHVVSNPDRLKVLWVYAAGWLRQIDHVHLGQAEEGKGPTVLVVQAPLVEGDGGGPLLDQRAELVGLLSGKVGPQQQIAYALALAEVSAFLHEARPRSAPRSAPELVERARLFVKAGRLERARADLDEAVRRAPRGAIAWSERGRVRQLRGDLEGALSDCNEAIRLDGKLVSAYVHRAAAWCDKGQPDKALRDCDKALALDRRSALGHAVRGQARLLRGEVDQAIADCDEAIWLDRQLAFAHLVRGQAHAHKNDQARATEDFTRALLFVPRSAEAHRRRGDAYWARSDVTASLADYEKALSLDPRDSWAHLGRGRGRLARGETADGVADLVKSVRLRKELVPDVLREVERRGDELTMDEPGRACELYRQALTGLAPFFADQPGRRKRIAAGLVSAAREPDLKKRAAALRKVLRALLSCSCHGSTPRSRNLCRASSLPPATARRYHEMAVARSGGTPRPAS